jgi:predicted PurR-regulated permease PerM
MKRLALQAATALATLAGVILLWRFREGLLLLALSLAVAATVRPAVRRLVAWRVPGGAALAMVYGAAVIVCAGVGFLIAGPLFTDAQGGANDLVRVYERFETAARPAGGFGGIVVRYLPPATELYRSIVGGAWDATLGVVGVVGRVVIVLALAIYWTASQDAFERLVLSLVSPGVRRHVGAIWRSVEEAVGARLRSEIGQSFLALSLLALCYRLLGVSHPTLPAVVGALTRFVPLVGAPLAILAAFAAGAVTGPAQAFGAAGCALGTLLLLTFAVAPRFAPARGQSLILQIVTMIVLVDAWGLAGLIAAAPLAAALEVIAGKLVHRAPKARDDEQVVRSLAPDAA